MNHSDYFERATTHAPYDYQASFASTPQLPSLLSIPTGAGKTAAVVLGWLWRRREADEATRAATPRRLVFCLPMRSLVEQTARVCAQWLERLGLEDEVAIHMMMGGAIARDWDDSPASECIIVGTQDQLLSRALNRGYAMSRFRWPIQFGWLNNDCLWIIDEVQLMGAGLSTSAQLHAFRRALGTHGPTHTVWMSATLAPGALDTVDLRGLELGRLELGERDRANPRLARRLDARKPIAPLQLSVDRKHEFARHLAAELLELHCDDSLTLVVCNQVARAQAVYRALDEHEPECELALIHSRFRAGDRSALATRVLSGEWSGILVATQTVEAGVDISARVLVTDLAAWPAMVQRFGRCNRAGELPEGALVRWLEVPDELAAPYTAEELGLAREHLRDLDDVGPARLAAIELERVRPARPVLRRRDLLDLFDTQADLAGHDIDVSAYVRSSEVDRDVHVAWRVLDDAPNERAADLQRDELCRVPLHQLEQMLGKSGHVWRWSSLRGAWEWVSTRALMPGARLLLATTRGGYSSALGWTGEARDKPRPIALPADAELPDHDAGDPWTHRSPAYVSLSLHSSDVVEALDALERALGSPEVDWPSLRRACRWHDLGKAHEVFQALMVAGLEPDDPRRAGVWAKSDGAHAGRRYSRSHFRHELASALAFAAQGASDLEAYLVAAHHGKVRLSIRSRPDEPAPKHEPERLYALGVYDGDLLPTADLGDGVRSAALSLDLTPMQLGRRNGQPSWTERALALLDALGPFRLAYLEALVRVADWRGTRARAARAANDVTGARERSDG